MKSIAGLILIFIGFGCMAVYGISQILNIMDAQSLGYSCAQDAALGITIPYCHNNHTVWLQSYYKTWYDQGYHGGSLAQ